jgi:DNA-binding NtrC family response regulator
MRRSRSALVVAATPNLAASVCTWLKLGGWHVATAHSYGAAKTRLEQGTDLLVTELELGDYNGLQLALRGQALHVPSVVIGRHDVVLERDAEQLGTAYVCKEDLDQHRLLVAVDVKIDAIRRALPALCRNIEFAKRPWSAVRLIASRRMLLH